MTGGRINNKTLSGYEHGVSEPDLETLKILSNLYEVSIDWLSGNNAMIAKESSEPYIINDQARNDVIEAYNRLPQDKKKLVDDIIRTLINED